MRRAQRKPDRVLDSSRRYPRQHQPRHVRAGDEEQESDRREQREQRLTNRTKEIARRMAWRRRGCRTVQDEFGAVSRRRDRAPLPAPPRPHASGRRRRERLRSRARPCSSPAPDSTRIGTTGTHTSVPRGKSNPSRITPTTVYCSPRLIVRPTIARVRPEEPRPHAVAQHHDFAAHQEVVLRTRGRTKERNGAEGLEEGCGHARQCQPRRLPALLQDDRPRRRAYGCGALEHPAGRRPPLELAIGDLDDRHAARRIGVPHHDEPARRPRSAAA